MNDVYIYMIKSVGFNQNIKLYSAPAFKAAPEQSFVTAPNNATLNGVDALASYNSAMIKPKKDDFDIPLIKSIQMPDDINSIDGERIYNSKDVLQAVVKETNDKKYVYTTDQESNTVYNSVCVYDKKTGKKYFHKIILPMNTITKNIRDTGYVNINTLRTV